MRVLGSLLFASAATLGTLALAIVFVSLLVAAVGRLGTAIERAYKKIHRRNDPGA